jgi:hypothetical protein
MLLVFCVSFRNDHAKVQSAFSDRNIHFDRESVRTAVPLVLCHLKVVEIKKKYITDLLYSSTCDESTKFHQKVGLFLLQKRSDLPTALCDDCFLTLLYLQKRKSGMEQVRRAHLLHDLEDAEQVRSAHLQKIVSLCKPRSKRFLCHFTGS